LHGESNDGRTCNKGPIFVYETGTSGSYDFQLERRLGAVVDIILVSSRFTTRIAVLPSILVDEKEFSKPDAVEYDEGAVKELDADEGAFDQWFSHIYEQNRQVPGYRAPR
jgi:hypothetical protein